MQIPYENLGSSGPMLHFAHANGFPPNGYRPLLEQLANHYQVLASYARPMWPNSDPKSIRNWWPLGEDLLRFFDEQKLTDLIGIGHSMGGTATLMAALLAPERFRAVVLVDPVLLTPWRIRLVRLLQMTGQSHRYPMVKSARRRQSTFESHDLMFQRYRRASVFQGLDDQALRTYIEAMGKAAPNGEGITLAYSPEWEAQIYMTMPSNIWSKMGQLAVPLYVIWGGKSNTFTEESIPPIKKRLPNAQFHMLTDGTHLFPLEYPKETAEIVHGFLRVKDSDSLS